MLAIGQATDNDSNDNEDGNERTGFAMFAIIVVAILAPVIVTPVIIVPIIIPPFIAMPVIVAAVVIAAIIVRIVAFAAWFSIALITIVARLIAPATFLFIGSRSALFYHDVVTRRIVVRTRGLFVYLVLDVVVIVVVVIATIVGRAAVVGRLVLLMVNVVIDDLLRSLGIVDILEVIKVRVC